MLNNIFKSKIEKHIELQISDLKLYLENNYKDLAIEALKDAISLIEAYYKSDQIKEKSYLAYKKKLGKYREQMKDYNHQQFYRT